MPEYQSLDDILSSTPEYEPLNFEDVLPNKKFKNYSEKYRYFMHLALSVPVDLLRYI
jgi:hypothetical protein